MKLKSFFQNFEKLDDYKQLEIKQKLLVKELLKPDGSQYLVGSLFPTVFLLQSSLTDIICNEKCTTSSQLRIIAVICFAIIFTIYFFASWIQKNEERKKLKVIKEPLIKGISVSK